MGFPRNLGDPGFSANVTDDIGGARDSNLLALSGTI